MKEKEQKREYVVFFVCVWPVAWSPHCEELLSRDGRRSMLEDRMMSWSS